MSVLRRALLIATLTVACGESPVGLFGGSGNADVRGVVTLDGGVTELKYAYAIPDPTCRRDLHLVFSNRPLDPDSLTGLIECFSDRRAELGKIIAAAKATVLHVHLGNDDERRPARSRGATLFHPALSGSLAARGVSTDGAFAQKQYLQAGVAGRAASGRMAGTDLIAVPESYTSERVAHSWSYDLTFEAHVGPLFFTGLQRGDPLPIISPTVDPAKAAEALATVTSFVEKVKSGDYAGAYAQLAPVAQPPLTLEQFSRFAERCPPLRENTSIECNSMRPAYSGAVEHLGCTLGTPAGRAWSAGFSFDHPRHSLAIEFLNLSYRQPDWVRSPSGLAVQLLDSNSEVQRFRTVNMASRPISDRFASFSLVFEQQILGPDERPVPGTERKWNGGGAIETGPGAPEHEDGARWGGFPLGPGAYVLRVIVTDEVRKENLVVDMKGFIRY